MQVNSPMGIKNPPQSIWGSLQYLGPGLILSAAIVGSGELIATTALGAKAGFLLLWIILFGCLIKVAVQLEYGRYCICHGLPTFQAWNRVGRVKFFSLHWTVYLGIVFLFANFFGQAGILGASAQVAVFAFPGIPIETWVVLLTILLGLLVFHGKYEPVEKIAALFNFVFVAAVLYCVISIQGTKYAFSLGEMAEGLTFQLPSASLGLALAAFGITGVSSGEIASYPYWCMEKGYAAWTGEYDGSPEWVARACGWMRVMTLDAVLSMAVYTVATCAFYILGAAVLSSQEVLQDGNEFILQLSALFTQVLGVEARNIFMVCAFTVLFSTVFSNTAAYSRLWTDVFGLLKWIDWKNEKQRSFSISMVAWIFPAYCGLWYFVMQKPLFLVQFLGISNSAYLLVVAWQAWVFRYRHTPAELQPSRFYDAAFWLSLASIGFMAVRTAQSVFG